MIRIVVLSLIALLGSAGEARAQSNAAYDHPNGVALKDNAVWRSAETFNESVGFDSSEFGEDLEYNVTPGSATRFAACGEARGAKSAWVHFSTAVSGRLALGITSGDRDVYYAVYDVPLATAQPGTAMITQLRDNTCYNTNRAAPDESYSFQGGEVIPAGVTVYVQVMTVCKYDPNLAEPTPCSAQERADAPGGPTTLTLTFDPDDADGDTVADGLDSCPSEAGSAAASPPGCPDADGDGKADIADACPADPGTASDGCRVPDEDGDGFNSDKAPFNGRDCDDNDPHRNPNVPENPATEYDDDCDDKTYPDEDDDGVDDRSKADCDGGTDPRRNRREREKPGNRVDENCDGKEAPFPELKTTVRVITLTARGTARGIAHFVLNDVVKGTRVRITCDGGRACPYGGRAKTYRIKKKAKEKIVGTGYERRGDLGTGTEVTITLTRRGYRGTARRYKVRKRGPLAEKRLCSEEGAVRLKRKCSGFGR